MIPIRIFLLAAVLVILYPNFTIGFPYRGVHGPNPEPLPNSPLYFPEKTHPAHEVDGVNPADATLAYCDEVESEIYKAPIDPPTPVKTWKLDKAGAKKIAAGKWHVTKEFVNMSKFWLQNVFRDLNGQPFKTSNGPPPKVPCLRRDLNQKG